MSADLDLGDVGERLIAVHITHVYVTRVTNILLLGVKVTTSSVDCQQWIDRGVAQMFGFNVEEAIRCFRRALLFDSHCAMGHYFIAHCYAPYYNNPDGLDCEAGYDEAHLALDMTAKKPTPEEWESALIKAQTHRFCRPVGSIPLAELCRNYITAMRSVYQKWGEENMLVATFFAESLMLLAPWALWTPPPEVVPAIPETEELVAVLEHALEREPTHPGLCHFYVHTMELSATPEKALPAADVLRYRVPDQGHLLHMASHIDMWVGQYKEAVDINKTAVAADEKYKSVTGHDNEIYKMYRLHNYHFTVWAAMFDGQFATAMEYAEAACQQLCHKAVTFTLDGSPVGAKFFEAFGSLPWHVLVRFGKWEDIVARPLKEDADTYPSTVAVSHYARGVAFAVLGRLEDAEVERVQFRKALKKEGMDDCYLFNNVMHDPKDRRGILDVAEAVLDGEVEYHKGNIKEAFEYLHIAVKRDASLIYDEPWGWMTPARHVLGALLLEQGELEEAETVYRKDLEQYKDNLWSLLGLHQALKKQNRSEEAASVLARFQTASERADIKIGASCLCATKLCCQ